MQWLRDKILINSRPQGYKTFFMLNSIEHEILNAHMYKKYQEIQLIFLGSDKPRMLFSPLINVTRALHVGANARLWLHLENSKSKKRA